MLASLILHALVLFGVPDLIETARRAVSFPPPIIARLMAPEPVAVPAPPLPAPSPPAQPAPAPPRKPAPAAATKPAPPAAARIAPEAPAAPSAEPPPAAPAQPVEQAAADPLPPAAAPAAASASQAPAVEEQSADRYRMELIAVLARRIKDSYPPLAKDNNWEGDVVLGIVIRANGNVAVSVKRSSRFGVLDEGAVAALRQAAKEVPVPAPLRGKESALKDLMVQYRLTD